VREVTASIVSFARARAVQLSEQFLALQAAIDDAEPEIQGTMSRGALELELDRVVHELEEVLAGRDAPEDLSRVVTQVRDAREAWKAALREAPNGSSTEDTADRFTLALIELALRIRGRRRRTPRA
jgi:hypothetical protein